MAQITVFPQRQLGGNEAWPAASVGPGRAFRKSVLRIAGFAALAFAIFTAVMSFLE